MTVAAGQDREAPGGGLTAILGLILQRDSVVPGTVIWSGEQIVELAVGRHLRPPEASTYEFTDGLIVPGLIDLHVHGALGQAVHEGEAAVAKVGRWLLANGTTGFLASVPALPWQDLVAASGAVARSCAAGEPPNLLGLHLEGPFLNPSRAGSIGDVNLRQPSLSDYLAFRAVAGQRLRMLTIAPELPGVEDVLAACVRDGVVAALGHSDASHAEANRGFAAGIAHVTHLFNAMRPFHHREPGSVGAALTNDTATAELILDGEHITQGAWRLARSALGPDRIALISDALPCAGLDHGPHAWLGQTLQRAGRRLTLAGGNILAGSDITLREAVRQAVAWGASPAEAVSCASAVPARVLGLGDRKGRLLPGYDADIVVMSPDWRPYLTICGGRRLWPEEAPRPGGRRRHRNP